MIALKFACIALVVATVAAQLGGPQQADPNDAGTAAAEKEARKQLLALSGVCNDGLKIQSQTAQVVNGMKYHFTYLADPAPCGESGPTKTCSIDVYSKKLQVVSTSNASCS